MDPQMQYAMERWNQMLNEQSGIRPPVSGKASWPMLGLYRHVVNQYLLNNPNYEGMDPDMVMRLMQRESNWNPKARGKPDWQGERARGVMQVKPSTAGEMVQKKLVSKPKSLFNPDENIGVGISYLDYLKRRYEGDWYETLQRYRVGPKAFREGKRAGEYADYILNEEEE